MDECLSERWQRRKKKFLLPLLCIATVIMASSCEGILNGIYDEPAESAPQSMAGRIYMDATSWTDWYYIDFDSLLMLSEGGDTAALYRMQTKFQAYPIPDSTTTERQKADSLHAPGIYTYWFDVFDKGLEVNEMRSYRPTASQAEPPSWSIAIHRDNVRTNGGAVMETDCSDLSLMPASFKAYADSLSRLGRQTEWVSDEWSENAVWTDRSQLLSCLVGSQGISVNPLLSSWLSFQLPPIPPSSTYNGHVFIIRLRNGRYVALRLVNYMNDAGTKCWMTIDYKYPY